MPRILLIGATGYLGSAIARSLTLSGNHIVYGLSRSAAKAPQLAALEITPIVCPDPAKDPEPYLSAIKKYRIDLVIDGSAAYGDSLNFLQNVASLSKARLTELSTDGIPPPKLGYIYISGLWVHGSSPHPTSDLVEAGLKSSPAQPLDMVAWRPQLERALLASHAELNACIIRPAQMYGYSSAAFTAVLAPVFDAVKNGRSTVEIAVPEDSYIATCHVDDVADAVRLAAENIETIGTGGAETGVYPIFDVSSNNESLKSVLQQFADVLGDHQGKTRVHLTGEATDMYLAAVSSTIKASSARARQYLGWTPRRVGMGVGLEVYARAWQAGFAGAK